MFPQRCRDLLKLGLWKRNATTDQNQSICASSPLCSTDFSSAFVLYQTRCSRIGSTQPSLSWELHLMYVSSFFLVLVWPSTPGCQALATQYAKLHLLRKVEDPALSETSAQSTGLFLCSLMACCTWWGLAGRSAGRSTLRSPRSCPIGCTWVALALFVVLLSVVCDWSSSVSGSAFANVLSCSSLFLDFLLEDCAFSAMVSETEGVMVFHVWLAVFHHPLTRTPAQMAPRYSCLQPWWPVSAAYLLCMWH